MNREPPQQEQKQDEKRGSSPQESKVEQGRPPSRAAANDDLRKVPLVVSPYPSGETNLKKSSSRPQAVKVPNIPATVEKMTPKKRRAAGVVSSSEEEETGITNPMLDEQIFNNIFECLDLTELIICTSVCNTWHKGVTQHTWETSATRKEPVAFKALQDATGGCLDKKSMAIGFARMIPEEEDAITIDYPDPTIQLQDVFLLIQLEAFNTKCAWCKNLTEFGGQNESNKVNFNSEVLEKGVEFCIPPDIAAANQETQGLDIHQKIIHHADFLLSNVTITMSLWRPDTGQSKCLCRRIRFAGSETLEELEPMEGGCSAAGFRCYLVPGGKTEAGRIARDLCYWGDIKYLSVFLRVEICPKLLQPDVPADDAEAAFVDNGEWKYHVCSLHTEFQCLEFDIDELEFADMTVKTFSLFLEGLDWK